MAENNASLPKSTPETRKARKSYTSPRPPQNNPTPAQPPTNHDPSQNQSIHNPVQGLTLDLESNQQEFIENYQNCLLGRVISDKFVGRRPVSFVVQRAWNVKNGFQISDWEEDIILFKFQDYREKVRVLEDSPWSINGKHLVLKELLPGKSLLGHSFNLSSFWIQVHGLPLDKNNDNNGIKIGNSIGRFERMDVSTPVMKAKSFTRIRVLIDNTKPLPVGFWLKKENEEPAWISFKIERLSDFCYFCGRLGHDESACGFKDSTTKLTGKYGPHMRAAAFKPWAMTIKDSGGWGPSSSGMAASRKHAPTSREIVGTEQRDQRMDSTQRQATPVKQNSDTTAQISSNTCMTTVLPAAAFLNDKVTPTSSKQTKEVGTSNSNQKSDGLNKSSQQQIVGSHQQQYSCSSLGKQNLILLRLRVVTKAHYAVAASTCIIVQLLLLV